jgi:hypothetical protein
VLVVVAELELPDLLVRIMALLLAVLVLTLR